MATKAKIPNRLGLFEPVERIGAGSMGEIYLCHDLSLDRHLVVKRMQVALRGYTDMVDRFSREVQVLAKLDHPNIVQVYGFWQEKGLLHLSMEFINGWTLRQILDKVGALPAWISCALLRDLAAALHHAHSHGIVHRDLKPSNIMLGFNGRTKLLDFGIVRLQDQDMTTPGTLIGTAAYMAPEQLEGRVATAQSDLFSLGIIAWELLSGKHPFRAQDPEQTARNILRAKPDSRQLPPNLSGNLRHLLEWTLERKPAKRPAEILPLLRLLDEELTGLPRDPAPLLGQWIRSIRKDKPGPHPPLPPHQRRFRWGMFFGLAVGGGLGYLLGALWI